jgi:hypothetical protein
VTTLRALIALLTLVSLQTASGAQEPFVHKGAARDGERYEASLKATTNRERTAREWREDAFKAYEQGADLRAAVKGFEMAIVMGDTDPALWLGLSRSLLKIKVEKTTIDRFELPVRATGAAYLAYQRASTPEAKAQALALLAEAFERRSMWRPAIEALQGSVNLKDDTTVREHLDKLRSERGFRMTDYKVDTEAATPRVCVQFSEELARGQLDYAKFITIDGRDPQSVTAEGQQLCIAGLQHGKRYEIVVRQGVPSMLPRETLRKSIELAVYVRDRAPFVRSAGNTYVLPSVGQAGIPLTSANTNAIAVEVYRIGDRSLVSSVLNHEFQRQIQSYEANEIKTNKGERVYTGELQVTSRLNEEVTTAFPVSEALPKLKPGVYVLVARPAKAKSPSPAQPDDEDDDAGPKGKRATQWFIVSDMGLTAFSAEDGVHAFVRSLASATPRANVEVRLVARNNEILATAKTDQRGYVRFDAGVSKGEGGLQPALLVAEISGTDPDYAFLDLTTAAFDLSDRGVSGREPSGALEAFVFPERGVYKPGETIHLTAIVRDKNAKAPRPVPVTLVIVRPDGVEAKRVQWPDEGHGGRVHDYALSATAMTGTWRVRVYADPKAPAIGEKAILVEDFVPERLDMTLAPEAPSLATDEARTIAVKGRYLYGPPAANLTIEGEVVVRQRTQGIEAWKGFRFGLDDEKLSPQRKELEASLRTDDKGEAKIAIELPALPQTTRLLEAQVALRLREPSGRSIERTIVLPVDRREPMIGLKPLFDPNEAGDGKTVEFEVIMLGPNGKRIAASTLNWQLKRIDYRWQWYSRDGSWNYEGVKSERKLIDGKVSVSADRSARIAVPIDWGRYKLEVTAEGRNGPVTTLQFASGWWGADNADSPEALDIALDKAKYKVGDTARLTINGLGSGKALVTVMGRGLVSLHEVEVKGRGTTVDLKVTEDWGTGVYVTATLYRPLDEKLKRMPGRSLGLKWVEIDREARSLKVAMTLPDRLSGSGRLRVPVKIDGLAPGEDARIVVSVVDVGILNLTRFEAPDPQKFFFSQRKLSAEIRDLYGRLIDGMKAERGKLRQGGDSDTNTAMKIEGSPQVEKPMALFSGIVRPDDKGNAVVEFDLPPFNGTVRLTTVAWSAARLGSAKTDVVVREPVALLVSGPRFMTLGDEVRLVVDLHNVDGKAGPYRIALVSVPGPDVRGEAAIVAAREVALKAGERKLEGITLKAERIGLMHYEVRVSGPEGIAITRPLTYAVKPPAGDIRRMTVATLNANGGKMTISANLLADVLPEKARVSLSVGPAIGLDLVGLLLSLDRYPYGCAEQTTSRAMPLVYLNDLARIAGLGEDKAVKARVQSAVERVLEMQASNGAFGVWGPRDADMWLTAYVTDFLTRAKEAGFTIPQRQLSIALDRLQNAVNSAGEIESGGDDIAYALYVLARNGRAPVGELRYNVDTRLDKFDSALAKTQLGAALAMLGDKTRAEKAFKAAIIALEGTEDQSSRSDYGSKLRDGAALITLASETRMLRSETVGLRQVLAKAVAARTHVSTQEQAWMLLAARALIEEAKDATVTVNGTPHKGPLFRSLQASDLKGGPITIANTSSRSSQVVVTVTGDAATVEPAIARGFKIVREYYTLDGKPFDLASANGGKAEIAQNQRLVAVLRIEAEGDERTGRLLLVDRLPAGLEIENPRLIDSASVKSLPWLKDALQPAHTEFRDDRFVAAFDLFPKKNGDEKTGKLVMAYMVRAVTPGTFLHPAATIEDMYRPERFARTAAGRLEVKARE